MSDLPIAAAQEQEPNAENRMIPVSGCSWVPLQRRGDGRGSLTAMEMGKEFPFAVERVYFIYDTAPEAQRGFHAHRDLEQLAVCVSGSCTLMLDDGTRRSAVRLESPVDAVRIGSMVWREMRDFTPGAVLLVLASKRYDEGDYIRDYDRFRAMSRADG